MDREESGASAAQPVLELRKVSKRFGGVQALDGVSLVMRPGEVHALLGENGAGKSTLIKIMTGVHRPDDGEIVLRGTPTSLANSADAQRRGVAAIYQEPLLFPDLSVAENIFIGHEDRGAVTRWRSMFDRAEAILQTLGITLDVRAPARGLTLAAQQSVEIAKAISLHVSVLIMDEPTASLSAHEAAQLLSLVKDLRRNGVAILFVSHRLEEVFAIADTITVFRDGRHVSSRPRAEVTPQSAIADMVGRDIGLLEPRRPAEHKGPLLAVRGLAKAGVFENVGFEVQRGEVLGFAGLIGAGRTDVALALFGIEPATAGTIAIDGVETTIRSPRDAMALGIAYVSEDRRQLGLVLGMPIAANISLPVLGRSVNRMGLMDFARERATAELYRKRLSVRTPTVDLEVGRLSGGNQQKVMLAKWLNTAPRLLILDEPTRGIDVGAKAEVHAIISELAAEGIAIILISSDLPEVLAMSDRVLVMREGRQMAILDKSRADQVTVMAAATGQGEMNGVAA